MKSDRDDNHKIVRLQEVWKTKKEQGRVAAILKDTKRIARAVEKRTCVLCETRKMCVNKTGLCAACYVNLAPGEKKVADKEAGHKRIRLIVTDDRWEKT